MDGVDADVKDGVEDKNVGVDDKTEKLFKKGIIGVAIGCVVVVLITLIFGGQSTIINAMLILLGVLVGVFVSYHMLAMVSEERQLEFYPQEKVILEANEKGKVYVVPQTPDGDFSPDMPGMEVSMYLLNTGILAVPPDSGEAVLFIPLPRIIQFTTEEKFFSKHLRVHYIDMADQANEVLLFLGKHVDEWSQKLNEILANQIY